MALGSASRFRLELLFPEDLPQRGEEWGELEGLLDVPGRRVPHLGSCLRFGQSREKEDASLGTDGLDVSEYLPPRHARHDEIKEHRPDFLRVQAEEGDPRGPIGGGQDREASTLQQVSENFADE